MMSLLGERHDRRITRSFNAERCLQGDGIQRDDRPP